MKDAACLFIIVSLFCIGVYSQTPTPLPSLVVNDVGGSPPASVQILFPVNSKSVVKTTTSELLQSQIASAMGISTENVIVVRTSFYSATVIICTGDVVQFANNVNRDNQQFAGTLLEGARVGDIIWNVPCEKREIQAPAPVPEEPQFPSSATSDYGRNDVRTSFQFSPAMTSLDFPTQKLPSSLRENSSTMLHVPLVLIVLLLAVL